jgi:ABC-type polysaccharide/polyol phosphate transport system ATPase subunit
MPGKGKKPAGKQTAVKKSKNEKKAEEARMDEKLTAEALPKYLTEGIVILDKDVLCESIFLYTPDGKVELVKNAKLQLINGRKYGLIGKNGIGALVCCLLSAVCYLLSAVCCLLSAVCCLLFAACFLCLLSAVC